MTRELGVLGCKHFQWHVGHSTAHARWGTRVLLSYQMPTQNPQQVQPGLNQVQWYFHVGNSWYQLKTSPPYVTHWQKQASAHGVLLLLLTWLKQHFSTFHHNYNQFLVTKNASFLLKINLVLFTSQSHASKSPFATNILFSLVRIIVVFPFVTAFPTNCNDTSQFWNGWSAYKLPHS